MSGERRSARSGQRAEGSEGVLDEVTNEVLPALIARLRSSRLGELEVRTEDWRVRLRLRRGPATARSVEAGSAGAAVDEGAAGEARSPAVGYFGPARGLAVGRSVQVGDRLGSVDVLGIAHDVVAPTDGIVSRILAEAGQAVEYGQVLVDIDSLDAFPVAGPDDPDGEPGATGIAEGSEG